MTHRHLTGALAAAVLAAALATGCARPPDEAWLRFLGFGVDGAVIGILEGDLRDGTGNGADALFENASDGLTKDGVGTGVLITRARVEYRLQSLSPPTYDYPVHLYIPPKTGDAAARGTIDNFPLIPVSLKRWIIDTGAFDPGTTPAIGLSARVTFYGETDEGIPLDTSGGISLRLKNGDDPGDKPVVTAVATDPTAEETPHSNGSIVISRTGPDAEGITVLYSITGTATNGTDFDRLTGTVVLSAGDNAVEILVKPIADADDEGEETVVVTLQASAAYTVGSPGSATVRITD